MAKPRELFNTPAPQAMSQMGAGIAEAYANAGRIQGQGVAAMGESIGKGIQAGVSAYAGYAQQQKQIESQNKAYDNLFKNPLVQNMFFQDKQGPEGVITAKDQASQFLAQTADMKPSEKNMFYNTVVPPAIGQYYKMQQIDAETAGRVRAAQKPPLDLSGVGSAIDSIWNPKPTGSQVPAAVVPVDQSMQGQDTTQPATDLAEFLRRKGWSGTGPVPKALMREFEASQPFPNPY